MGVKKLKSVSKYNGLILDIMGEVRGKVGLNFLKSLTRSVAEQLNIEHVFVGVLLPDGLRIETVVNWANGELRDNFTYDLDGTPCENVVENKYCVYRDKVAELFPDDPDLKDLHICGYAGYPLTDINGHMLGVFSVMACKPLDANEGIYDLLEFYSQRAALELERIRHEEQMIQMLANTERANLAKSEFLANMSHDLKTPLNAINGFSQLLEAELHGPLADQYKDYAKLIHQAGVQLQRMIDDILIMSKLEAGRVQPNASRENIEELLNWSVNEILNETRYQDLDIRIDCPNDLPAPSVDRDMLITAIRRLVESAADANKEKDAFITTISATSDKIAPAINIQIKDNGAGISNEPVSQVLNPFDRGNPALSKGKAERGIALFLAATIVDLIGGGLSLVSDPHSGTEITVSVPL
jgi:signal transduction histidine kinase